MPTITTGPLDLQRIDRLDAGRVQVRGSVGKAAFSLDVSAAALVSFDAFAAAMLAAGYHPEPYRHSTPSLWHAAVSYAATAGTPRGATPPQTERNDVMSDARKQLAAVMGRLQTRFGAEHGQKLTMLGFNEPQAETFYGTPFCVRILRHDPASELDAFKAAAVCGMSLSEFLSLGPACDRKQNNFSFWKPSSLATWVAGHCPTRDGKGTRPEMLARIGALKPTAPTA